MSKEMIIKAFEKVPHLELYNRKGGTFLPVQAFITADHKRPEDVEICKRLNGRCAFEETLANLKGVRVPPSTQP